MLTLGVILAVVFVLLILIGIGIYNSTVALRNKVDNAWYQIDVQLRKRYDLIPNLVETVKGYAAHEKETLEKVVSARNLGIEAKTVKEQEKAENQITSALRTLFALSERYPNLKADQHFLRLMEELNGVESNIAYARQFYNDMVMRFNTRIQTFPGNVIAKMFNFTPRDYFEIEEASAREPVRVEF
ncbi:MAG: LemA family protein [Actinobacteria bacterium]|nr:LemA family protein [Actinomycetota bacterium]